MKYENKISHNLVKMNLSVILRKQLADNFWASKVTRFSSRIFPNHRKIKIKNIVITVYICSKIMETDI